MKKFIVERAGGVCMERTYTSLRQLDHHDNSPVRVYLNQEPDDYPAHWHRSYEIIMPVQDRYTLMVDNEKYELLPGEVIVIPSGVVHEIFAPEHGKRYILMVDQKVIYGIEGLTNMQHMFYPCTHLRLDRDQGMIDAACDDLWNAIREKEKGDMLNNGAVVAWVSLFMIRLGRRLWQRKDADQGEHRRAMNETFLNVYTFIAEHCTEKLTLEDMADYSGYSKYHFARIFREYSGMSFYEFYMRQRMMLCHQLLAEMDMPVTEVALRSGFGSIATFNRVFKQYEGITPTQYRQLRQRGRSRNKPPV